MPGTARPAPAQQPANSRTVQDAIPPAWRLHYAADEYQRAMADVCAIDGADGHLTLNDFVLYYFTELAATLPIHRGLRNRKGRKLSVCREAALAGPAVRTGATSSRTFAYC